MSASLLTRVLAAFLLAGATGVARADPPRPHQPRQIVIISFDGAREISQWQRSRALAAATGARFTYFISCVFLLPRDSRKAYRPPGMSAGRSNVGFAESADDVGARLAEIWSARNEGHDIASHGCGHFDGKDFSERDWRDEFASFKTILTDAYSANGIAGEPAGWRDFAQNGIRGFRAPYLSTGKSLDAALVASGFLYDASGVSRGPARPQKSGGLTSFALPQIPEGPSGRRVIAMDYNLFVRHSAGIERKDRDGVFEERTLAAFRAAFEAQYQGDRIPLQLGFHFTLMNDGAYWRALERFTRETCGRSEVDCISYADYLQRGVDRTHVGDVDG